MLFELIEKHRGREKVIMRDERPQVLARRRELRKSRRGTVVDYDVRPTDNNQKFQRQHRYRSH